MSFIKTELYTMQQNCLLHGPCLPVW